jgi:hypothetical protein
VTADKELLTKILKYSASIMFMAPVFPEAAGLDAAIAARVVGGKAATRRRRPTLSGSDCSASMLAVSPSIAVEITVAAKTIHLLIETE